MIRSANVELASDLERGRHGIGPVGTRRPGQHRRSPSAPRVWCSTCRARVALALSDEGRVCAGCGGRAIEVMA